MFNSKRPTSQTPSNVASNPAAGRRPSPSNPVSYQRPPGSLGASPQPPHTGLQSPPPPQNYGHGPRPVDPAASRPSVQNRPPRTPNPPDPDSPELFPLFRAANKSQSGSLSEAELSSALVNGDYTAFDPHTIRVMMQMFDTSGRGSINYEEFVALWRFLAAWRELFERFDEDRSGRISLQEFSKSLVAFGYRLSPQFVSNLYNTFNRNKRGDTPGMSFDLFVQACVSLKRLTDTFKTYDDDRDGYITISFEEFLMECLKLREYLVK